MQRLKLIAAAILTVLMLVLVAQNTEPVETQLLFATVTMPRAALLAITSGIGVAIGLLAALWLSTRKDS